MFVAGEAMDSTPTGCSDAIGTYPSGRGMLRLAFSKDRQNNCRPTSGQVDQTVLNFLNDSPEFQRNALRNPQICSYYRDLHSRLLTQPKFVGLTCGTPSARRITLTTQDANGVKLAHDILYSENKSLTQMNIRNVTGKTPEGFNRWSRNIVFNSDGSIQNIQNRNIANTAINTKIYVMDAVDCCFAGENDRQKCLSRYNSEQATTRGRERNSGTPSVR